MENIIESEFMVQEMCVKNFESGLAESCFVSDMSTGFSGNLGYKIPKKLGF